MKFTELNFENFNYLDNADAVQAKHFFPNGYGVSVVRHPGSYGFLEGLYELAVLKGTEDNWELCYDTPVTSDVLGHLSEQNVEDVVLKVQSL
jgi:hypothetical protein